MLKYASTLMDLRVLREQDNSSSTIGYTQVFRNGTIETVDMSLLGINAQNVAQFGTRVEPRSFSGEKYERKLVETVKRYIELPFFIIVSFLEVKDYKISIQKSEHHIIEYTDEIDRTNLIIPEVMVEDFDVNLADAMKPIFNTV